MTIIEGFVARGYEDVVVALQDNFAARGETGASFTAMVHGRLVVDVWGGVVDDTGRPWERDTVACIFSGSKGLVATCMAILIDRGLLDPDRPVASYWPEFAAKGKGGVLVRHVLSHRSGLPGLTTPVTVLEAMDDRRMATLLAAQRPQTPIGEWRAYHALTFGWMCGELVRRTTGLSIGEFFEREISGPLGIDAWIGIPPNQVGRVATLASAAPLVPTATGGRDLAWSIQRNPPRFDADAIAANDPLWLMSEVPATNAVAGSSGLARMYACLANGGELGGVRLMSAATLETVGREQTRGIDYVSGTPMSFGLGYQLQAGEQALGPELDAFGHPGAGGSVHGAWPSLNTGFSYVTRQLTASATGGARSSSVLAALHRAVELNANSVPDTVKLVP